MGWHDARYDGLVAQAAREEDASRRADLLAHAARRALDYVPFIPNYWYVSKHLVKPRVQGWHDHLLDPHYSKDLRVAELAAGSRLGPLRHSPVNGFGRAT